VTLNLMMMTKKDGVTNAVLKWLCQLHKVERLTCSYLTLGIQIKSLLIVLKKV
jgi:hypothetical protein